MVQEWHALAHRFLLSYHHHMDMQQNDPVHQAVSPSSIPLVPKESTKSPFSHLLPPTCLDREHHDEPIAGGHPSVGSFAGFYAGFAKVFAAKTTTALHGASKGLFKWWFRYPIKLFRPHAVNPWLVFTALAQNDGKRVSVHFVRWVSTRTMLNSRDVMQEQGVHFFSKNMLPLLIANGVVGMVLFNTYGRVVDSLDTPTPPHAPPHFYASHAFIAGFAAGAAQSLLAVPLYNIQSAIHPELITSSSSQGMLHVVTLSLQKLLPPTQLGLANITRHMSVFLYKDFIFNAIKDSLGFMLFFGVFESCRHQGRSLAHRLYSHLEWPLWTKTALECSAVLCAGGLAGMSYQLCVYPMERLISIMTPNPMTLHHILRVLQKEKPSSLFNGIGSQLVRAMPPSAIALLIYELALNDDK